MDKKGNPPKAREAGRSSKIRSAQASATNELPSGLCAHPEEPIPAKAFTIVGIGASAGGLAAVEAFLSAMPEATDTPVSFVLVQHLSPDHKSILPEIVQRYTRLSVHEVEDGMEVQPNSVYVIPPNRGMALLRGKLYLFEPNRSMGGRLTIDHFFKSLAADQHSRAVGIVLSGAGSDGALGVRAIKEEGGMVMVQTPASTEFDGMPRAAAASGIVDYMLPPAEMPAQLLAYLSLNSHGGKRRQDSLISQEMLAKVAVVLRTRTGHDFSQYKESTLRRRMERRMALQQVESADNYLNFVRQSPDEADALFRDLLIGVTSFFRDDAFATIEHNVIPKLFERASADVPIRMWVCACSTGEEAYSISILMREHIERTKSRLKVQIFATDIDRRATDQGRMGVFHAGIAADISPERLSRHFIQEPDGSYRINKSIRQQVIFSEQDVLRDPPFSKLDFISCRNLLIYLNPELQNRLISLFHYALNPSGFLFLGSSENIGHQGGLFESFDGNARVYVRRPGIPGSQGRQMPASIVPGLTSRRSITATEDIAMPPKIDLRDLVDRAILGHVSAAGVLTNIQGDICYFYGRTGDYLAPNPGHVSANIFTMAREGLRRDLTSALQYAISEKEPTRLHDLKVEAGGRVRRINLVVLPVKSVPQSPPDLFLVLFELLPSAETVVTVASSAALTVTSDVESRIGRLEQELQVKDEYLQVLIEQMATSREELTSSNEELQSTNEELQSTNEELETSKEELQSVNEELATVNAELNDKVMTLSRANNDMNNLLAGTGVGTLFVDHNLRISRFTPAITEVLNLIPSDVGRPLAHTVTRLLLYDRLITDVQSVLDTLVPIEAEAGTREGRWYLIHMRPYRTLNNMIEGAVITFTDITARKTIQAKLDVAERYRSAADIETVGIVFFDPAGLITFCNAAFLRFYGFKDKQECEGVSWASLTPPEWSPQFEQALDELKASGRAAPYTRQYLRNGGSRGWGLFTARRMGSGETVEYVIDTTETKFAQLSFVDLQGPGLETKAQGS